jgi:dihydrofolate reductase
MRAGLIDEYQVVTHPVLVGGGTPFSDALDTWVNLRSWRRESSRTA